MNLSHWISIALEEDRVEKDLTLQALKITDKKGKGVIYGKSRGVLAGIEVAKAVFHAIDSELEWKALKKDGDLLKKGEPVAEVYGRWSSILKGERTALNFLMRLSGIATETRKYVDLAKPYSIQILDTRKTTPGLRELEKYAVTVGGGKNHRKSLEDQILIKENHIAYFGSIEEALKKAKLWVEGPPKRDFKIEIEIESLEELKKAAPLLPDIIMLDNMKGERLKEALAFLASYPTIEVEVSGGIHLKNLHEYLLPGVHRIAIGSLTHSYKALDFSLLMEEQKNVPSR